MQPLFKNVVVRYVISIVCVFCSLSESRQSLLTKSAKENNDSIHRSLLQRSSSASILDESHERRGIWSRSLISVKRFNEELPYITIKLSIQLQNTNDGKASSRDASDIKKTDEKLAELLLQTTARSLCEEDTDLYISTKVFPDRDYCEPFYRIADNAGRNRHRFLEKEQNATRASPTKLFVDPYTAVFDSGYYTSVNDPTISWIEVGIEYNVVEVGDVILLLSGKSVGTITPIDIIEQRAQAIINVRINNDILLDMLQQEDNRVFRVSSVGSEELTFAGDEDYYYEQKSFDQKYFEHDPKPFHGTRIAGMVLLGGLFSFLFILSRSAKQRSDDGKNDEVKRIAEREGGLATDQGVDAMLEVGRMKASGHEPVMYRQGGSVASSKSEIY